MEDEMSEDRIHLPLLPLDEEVVLPHMAVPVALESDEVREAINAGRRQDKLVLLVPRVDGRYASVGTVARIQELGRLPDGREAAVLRGLHRGRLTGAATENDGTLWISIEPIEDPTS